MSEKIKLNEPRQNNHGWYVGVANESRLYLHRDCMVRKSTKNESGRWTGYFATEEKALAAINKYKAK